MDDILIIYDENLTDIHKVHTEFNKLAPTLKFTIETEKNNKINYLDIEIQSKEDTLIFGIYRKPTATDVIIHKTSCHPPEHKHAAIRHMVNRMNSYRLNDYNKHKEQQVIEQIVTNNGYDQSIIKHFKETGQKTNNNSKKESWATFTYFGKATKTITKLFKDTQLRIAYKTNNTIRKRLSPNIRNNDPQQQYDKCGVYCITCPDCDRKYIGQTGRAFHKRHKEHFHDYKHNIRKSSFATHLLDNNHSIGPINEIMTVLHTMDKGRYMDTIEKYYIYKETQKKTTKSMIRILSNRTPSLT